MIGGRLATLLVLTGVLGAAGCKKSAAPRSPAPEQEQEQAQAQEHEQVLDEPDDAPVAEDRAAEASGILDEMQGITDEICKCADMECAEPHGQQLDPLENRLMELYPDKSKVPAELLERGEAIEQAIMDCVSAMTGS